MAGRPIVIEFAANVRDWLRGTRRAEDSLEDLADEIDDATKDAQRFEDRFGDAMKSAERDADRSARNIGRDFSRVEDDMGDIGKEGASEFKQNLSETLSSGGGVEDIVQDTLAGVVSGLEGALGGVLAGVATIAALMFQKARQEAEVQAQALTDLADGLMEKFLEYRSSILSSNDAAELLATNVQENTEHWQHVADLADTAGVNWAAMAEDVIKGGEDAEDVYERLRDIIAEGTETGARGVQHRTDEANAALELLGILQDTEGEVQDVAAEYRLVEEALRRTAGYSSDVARNLKAAQDYSRGLRGELPYRGGNVPV